MSFNLTNGKGTLSPLPKDVQREILFYLSDNDLYSIECKIVNDENDYYWKKKLKNIQTMLVDIYVLDKKTANRNLTSFGVYYNTYGEDNYSTVDLYSLIKTGTYTSYNYIDDLKDTFTDDELWCRDGDHDRFDNFWKDRAAELIYNKPSEYSFKEYYEFLKYRKQVLLNNWDVRSRKPADWRKCTFIHELLDDKTFLQKYINTINQLGKSLLSYLCSIRWKDIDPVIKAITLLIEHKADVNLDSPLIDAVHNNNKEIIKILLDAGANVNQVDTHGYTPLLLSKDVEISSLLLKYGANVNLKIYKLNYYIKKRTDEQLCEIIYDFEPHLFKSEYKKFDIYVTTPLKKAVLSKNLNLNLIKLYLEHGAILDDASVDIDGKTIRQIMQSSGNGEILALLDEYSSISMMNSSSKPVLVKACEEYCF